MCGQRVHSPFSLVLFAHVEQAVAKVANSVAVFSICSIWRYWTKPPFTIYCFLEFTPQETAVHTLMIPSQICVFIFWTLMCAHIYSHNHENTIKWSLRAKTTTSDSLALNSSHVAGCWSSKQSVGLPWKAAFLHQKAAVEMKQLLRVVIFRGANSPPLC